MGKTFFFLAGFKTVSENLLPPVEAFPHYKQKIPNADQFAHLGHVTRPDHSGSPWNSFGERMKMYGVWTKSFCQEDSDGDGLSNGVELGDPDCTWTEGTPPACGGCPSHPGDASEAVECGKGTQCIDGDAIKVGREMHGWMMILSWCICAPAMIIVAMYRRYQIQVNGATVEEMSGLMKVHKGGQLLTLLIMGVGIILIKTEGHVETKGGHGKPSTHASLGMIVTILGIGQIATWFCMKKGWIPRWTHKSGGILILSLALMNVYFGSNRLDDLHMVHTHKTVATILILLTCLALLVVSVLLMKGLKGRKKA